MVTTAWDLGLKYRDATQDRVQVNCVFKKVHLICITKVTARKWNLMSVTTVKSSCGHCQKSGCKHDVKLSFAFYKVVSVLTVDRGYTEWGSWGPCSSSCGLGIQVRHRNCTNPLPSNHGNDCVGQRTEIQGCNSGPCPGTSKLFRLTRVSSL